MHELGGTHLSVDDIGGHGLGRHVVPHDVGCEGAEPFVVSESAHFPVGRHRGVHGVIPMLSSSLQIIGALDWVPLIVQRQDHHHVVRRVAVSLAAELQQHWLFRRRPPTALRPKRH